MLTPLNICWSQRFGGILTQNVYYTPCLVLLDSFISVAQYRMRPLTETCQQQPITPYGDVSQKIFSETKEQKSKRLIRLMFLARETVGYNQKV